MLRLRSMVVETFLYYLIMGAIFCLDPYMTAKKVFNHAVLYHTLGGNPLQSNTGFLLLTTGQKCIPDKSICLLWRYSSSKSILESRFT